MKFEESKLLEKVLLTAEMFNCDVCHVIYEPWNKEKHDKEHPEHNGTAQFYHPPIVVEYLLKQAIHQAWLASRQALHDEQFKKKRENMKIFQEWFENRTEEAFKIYKESMDKKIKEADEKWSKATPIEKYRIWWHDLNRVNGTPSSLEEIEDANASAFGLGLKLQKEADIEKLEEKQPYSPEVFLPRTKAEMARAAQVLKEAGLSPDGIFGNFGRDVWNNAIAKLKEE